MIGQVIDGILDKTKIDLPEALPETMDYAFE